MITISHICRAAVRRVVALGRFFWILLRERLFRWSGMASIFPGGSRHSLHFAGKAVQFCRGTGIEIGSLHKRLPLVANVLYLDVQKTAELRELYKDDERVSHIGQVQLVAPGNRYPFIDDDAFDFVVSSHVLEHTCNPPRQIQEWLRIVRPGGIVYMIVPDKRYCFDRRRELTPIEHFVEEFESDTASITLEHYRDYIINTNGEDGLARDTSDAFIEKCHEQQRSIHAHTFTAESLRQFLDYFGEKLSYQLVHFDADRLDIHAALRKL